MGVSLEMPGGHTYHRFSWLEAGQRGDRSVRVMECVSNVSVVDTAYPHHHIPHLTTQPAEITERNTHNILGCAPIA